VGVYCKFSFFILFFNCVFVIILFMVYTDPPLWASFKNSSLLLLDMLLCLSRGLSGVETSLKLIVLIVVLLQLLLLLLVVLDEHTELHVVPVRIFSFNNFNFPKSICKISFNDIVSAQLIHTKYVVL